MTQRFLVYPILFIVAMQLVPLLRRDQRWFAAQIAQLSETLLACLGALFFSDQTLWVIIAWVLFVAFVVAPRLLERLAAGRQSTGNWALAGRLWRASGRLTFGRLGRLHRAYGVALRRLGEGHRHEAEALLNKCAGEPMPHTVRGLVRLWELTLLHGCRDWSHSMRASMTGARCTPRCVPGC